MSLSPFFNNKNYISAKEASLITGYSQDYIGQLARGNKIDSKRIGRIWYVREDAILNYKKFLNQEIPVINKIQSPEIKKIQSAKIVDTGSVPDKKVFSMARNLSPSTH